MTIFRYLFRETLKTQIAVLFVLFLIFISQKFVHVLAMAMKGKLPGLLIAEVVMLNLPVLALLILPISLFIGILFAHGRLHAESEIVVLNACGYSQNRVLGSTMILALLTTAVAAANAFWLAPAAAEAETKVFEKMDADVGLATLKQGRFQQLADGQAVVYVEDFSDGKTLRKVFVAQSAKTEQERPSVVVAETGRIREEKDHSQWLQLSEGQRYEGQIREQDFRVIDFERYQVQIREQETGGRGRGMNALPTVELWGSKEISHVAELQWRMAQVFAIPLLTLMVVPLAVVNPRQGRYAKLLPALMLFLAYFMLLSAARSAVEDETLAPMPGLWLVHGGALAVGVGLNLRNTSWFNRLLERWDRGASRG